MRSCSVEGPRLAVNYGLNRVSVPGACAGWFEVAVGRFSLEALDDFEGGSQVTLKLTFEVDGASKPSCVADVIFRYYN